MKKKKKTPSAAAPEGSSLLACAVVGPRYEVSRVASVAEAMGLHVSGIPVEPGLAGISVRGTSGQIGVLFERVCLTQARIIL